MKQFNDLVIQGFGKFRDGFASSLVMVLSASFRLITLYVWTVWIGDGRAGGVEKLINGNGLAT